MEGEGKEKREEGEGRIEKGGGRREAEMKEKGKEGRGEGRRGRGGEGVRKGGGEKDKLWSKTPRWKEILQSYQATVPLESSQKFFTCVILIQVEFTQKQSPKYKSERV